MPLLPVYSGKAFQPGYAGIEAQAFKDADRVNGSTLVPGAAGAEYLPRLSNGQLVAFVRAWRRAAARSKSPAWPIAYDLTIAGLGWEKPGDKFVMTDAHMNQPADPALLAMYWAAVSELAKRLDASGTILAPLIVDWSKAGYEAAARDAWHDMQISQGTAPMLPASTALSVSPAGDSSGWGAPLLLIVLLLAAGETQRKKRKNHGKAS
jgi:hypothetical protein